MYYPAQPRILQNRRALLAAAAILTVLIALADFYILQAFSLGFLYLFPIMIAACTLDRWRLAGFCIACDILRDAFGSYHWDADSAPRFIIAFVAYFGSGLFVSEVMRNRGEMLARLAQLAEQINARERAEAQLRGVLEGNPAATFATDGEGTILLANETAHQLLKCEPQGLPGQALEIYLPAVAAFCKPNNIRRVRTMVECSGCRRTGETFLAHVWVSSAGPPWATGLTAVVFDASEQLRSSQEAGLHTMILSARVVMGAFWHETRSLCSAMRVMVNRLKQRPGVQDTEEVEALDTLVDGLGKLCSAGLRPDTGESFHVASLRAVLEHLRIIIEPWREESRIEVVWEEPPRLPLVRADQHALLQVFLNLASNARRAMESCPQKKLTIATFVRQHQVLTSFTNTGSPVADPGSLFMPFQPKAADYGIGLHVSRALVRSFGGDLRYEPTPAGACFTVALAPRYLEDISGEEKS